MCYLMIIAIDEFPRKQYHYSFSPQSYFPKKTLHVDLYYTRLSSHAVHLHVSTIYMCEKPVCQYLLVVHTLYVFSIKQKGLVYV